MLTQIQTEYVVIFNNNFEVGRFNEKNLADEAKEASECAKRDFDWGIINYKLNTKRNIIYPECNPEKNLGIRSTCREAKIFSDSYNKTIQFLKREMY